MDTEFETTTRDGQTIAFQRAGRSDAGAPVVLLLHPLFTNRGIWTLFHFVDALSEGFSLVMPDSLGHGASSAPADIARYSQSNRAADAVAVLDAIGAEQAHVVGYSMGAWTGGAVAALFPDRVKSLVHGGWDPFRGANAPGTSTKPETIRNSFAESLEWFRATPFTSGFIDGTDDEGLRNCHRVLFDAQDDLSRAAAAQLDTFFFCGTEDAFFRGASEAAEAHEGARFLPVEGADHRTAIGLPDVRTAVAEFLSEAAG